MHFVSIHVIEFSESLEDIVIILCSINVKIAKIGLTWFAKQQCLQLFCLFFFTQEYISIKIYETEKRCEVQTHIQSVELMKQTFLASCLCALETHHWLTYIHYTLSHPNTPYHTTYSIILKNKKICYIG